MGPNESGRETERLSKTDPERDAVDLSLLERISLGDQHAFNAFCEKYEPRLNRFLFAFTGRPQVVEEAVSDTLMAVWQGAGAFRGTSKVSTWVFTIAYRTVLMATRRQDLPVEDSGLEGRVDEDPGPAEVLERKRLKARLAEAMETLSLEHRTVILLTYYQGLGYREIARIVNCPVDTVKTRMFYARRHLRKHLEGNVSDWI